MSSEHKRLADRKKLLDSIWYSVSDSLPQPIIDLIWGSVSGPVHSFVASFPDLDALAITESLIIDHADEYKLHH